MKLITGAECVRKMRQAGVFKGKNSYFSQLVAKGIIPYHEKKGSPKKWYILKEVKEAIKEWEDPSRDAQREANEKKRNSLQSKTQSLLKYIDLTKSFFEEQGTITLDMFEYKDDELTQKELDEINAQNLIIRDMIIDLINTSSRENLTDVIEIFNILEFLQKWYLGAEGVAEFYGVTLRH